MIKRSINPPPDDGLLPPLQLARPTPFWKTRKFVFGGLLGAVAAVIYVEAAYFLFWDELPAVWQRLLGLAYVLAAVGVYALVTRQTESAVELLNRARKGQHSDFGKRLRKAQERRTKVKLPLLGETSFRAIGGFAVFMAAACWWLSPLSPVRITEVVVEDLTAPLGEELTAVVLAMADTNVAVLQPPILPDHTRKLAELIDDSKANHYQRGLKAIAQNRLEDARSLLAEAMRHDDAPAQAIHIARALNEMYAWRFEDAATWYHNAVNKEPDNPVLLCQLAVAWMQAGKFGKAGPLIARAIEICQEKSAAAGDEVDEDAAAEDGDSTASSDQTRAVCLHLQAVLYVCLGKKLDQAHSMCGQARTIIEEVSNTQHPVNAASLNTQAVLYLLRAEYPGAGSLGRGASDAWTAARRANHPHVAASLGNLAMRYCNQGKYSGSDGSDEAAEELLRRAWQYQTENLAENHPALALGYNTRAVVQIALGRGEEAQRLAEKALAISTKALGPDHPMVAPILDTLATAYTFGARYTKAALYYDRAVAVAKEVWGESHPYLAGILIHQAQLRIVQGRHEEAAELCQQALEIYKQAFGEEHPGVAAALHTGARAAIASGDTTKARSDLREALRIRQKAFGDDGAMHRDIARAMGDLGSLDNSARYYADGVDRYSRAIEMTDGLLGLEHPETAKLLVGMAKLHIQLGKYDDAGSRLKRALEIRQATLVPYHPDLAATLDIYATVLRKIDQPDPGRADKMEARAKEIRAEHAAADRPE